MISFAATSEKWFSPSLDFPQCFIHGRVQYMNDRLEVIKGVTKGSVITYLGNDIEKFYESFKEYGTVKIPYHKV